MTYALLFGLGFANEALLTAYYVNAAHGRRWLCVALSLGQQAVAAGSLWFNVIEAVDTRERITRLIITAISYGCATAFVVRPKEAT